jgi:hypothetical protein
MGQTIAGLAGPLESVEQRRKVLEVYTDSPELVADLREQFSTRNVDIVEHPLTSTSGREFVVIRTTDGSYSGALGIEQFQKILSPSIQFPFEVSDPDEDLSELFDFLDNTIFASFDRRQMLAVSREIEERAWRVGRGRLYVGFQRAEAITAQRSVYETFASHSDVEARLFIADELSADLDSSIEVVSNGPSELGQYWFLMFDGGGDDELKCGLLAEEREDDEFYGFWTYEAAMVDDIMAYLDRAYS